MSLRRARLDDLPADAVILSQDEAVKYQMKLMTTWENKWDTFAFRYGPAILGGFAFMSGAYVNGHFRRIFKLFNRGRMSTYFANCMVPTAFAFVFHTQFVSYPLMLQTEPTCPVCIELRSSAVQAFSGGLVPAILGPLASAGLAIRSGSVDFPSLEYEPKKLFHFWRQKLKPISNTLFAIFIAQAFIGCAVTYFESKSLYTVNTKLANMEYEMENRN